MTFDAVIFDLDGTLVQRTQDTAALYDRAFDRVGVEPFAAPPELWAVLDGPPDPADEVGYLGAGFARLAAQHGRRVDAIALAEAFVAGVDNAQVAFRAEAADALDAAREATATAVLTNGPEARQAEKVGAVGLAERVDAVVYAGDMPRRKPHAAPFEATLSTLGVPADRALYVGDSLAYDVAGAHNAGLAAAYLDDGDGPDPYSPEYVLDSLADLPAVLE
ncbi:HAD family hydrolase [Haloarcula onubensis]|uniref:HAD family hydrolase n=1 Tax=Haloarcula onubensis TaxID=2950539 RepID=A0ABU2FSG1_9EURY|nr:HAD family hydrolase [Halomicroarcula sp. S3CR25-11]MDS0283708.1 HAD family hydrolase [Halomicroarcula sp. S3CR25-11]